MSRGPDDGHPPGRISRRSPPTWTGTLTVPGLDFDVTPPTLAGATNKTVRAKKGAKSARVVVGVTAQDDRDGTLPVSCSARSGSRFRIGRTPVTCSSTDGSANTAKATFTVTVRPTK
ncbi:MAG: HYR domain-containing protein [Gaiella sp.]